MPAFYCFIPSPLPLCLFAIIHVLRMHAALALNHVQISCYSYVHFQGEIAHSGANVALRAFLAPRVGLFQMIRLSEKALYSFIVGVSFIQSSFLHQNAICQSG